LNEDLQAYMRELGEPALAQAVPIEQLLKRPKVSLQTLLRIAGIETDLPPAWLTQIENDIRYEGYAARQEAALREQKRQERTKIPPDLDYDAVHSLRTEAKQKLKAIRPANIAAAAAISGVNPADAAALVIHLKRLP